MCVLEGNFLLCNHGHLQSASYNLTGTGWAPWAVPEPVLQQCQAQLLHGHIRLAVPRATLHTALSESALQGFQTRVQTDLPLSLA